MSVSNEIFFCSFDSPHTIAQRIASVLGVDLYSNDLVEQIIVQTGTLLPATEGQFGGNLEIVRPDWQFHLPGEYQATDAYNLYWLLSLADGPSEDEAGNDLAKIATSAVFERLTALNIPMLQTHEHSDLIAAHLPTKGTRFMPPDTTVFETDEAEWGEWVIPSPAKGIEGRTP